MNIANVVQDIIKRLTSGEMSVEEIRPLIVHSSALVRCAAIEAMSLQLSSTPTVLDDLVNAILRSENAVTLMGTITIGHMGLASLLRSPNQAAQNAAKHLLSNWPSTDLENVRWYLKSEGLSID